MSSLVPETNWAQGATVTGGVYDTSPAGLGLSPAYLASASASASSSNTTSGTIFPTTPADGSVFVYLADATLGIKWPFQYRSGSASASKWEAIGPTPLFSEVTNADSTTSVTYAALANAGPSIILPFAGDYIVEIGGTLEDATNAASAYMSYDIGGTGAVDADAVRVGQPGGANSSYASVSRPRFKTGLTAVTLTAKYRVTAGTAEFSNRWMKVAPIRVTG